MLFLRPSANTTHRQRVRPELNSAYPFRRVRSAITSCTPTPKRILAARATQSITFCLCSRGVKAPCVWWIRTQPLVLRDRKCTWFHLLVDGSRDRSSMLGRPLPDVRYRIVCRGAGAEEFADTLAFELPHILFRDDPAADDENIVRLLLF